jgi:hypothetical protein
VGRIYDWYKKSAGSAWDEAASAGANDPGVKSVRQIYLHYKHFGIATEVMGASFRNTGQILALAGCDLLTISPELLAQLAASDAPLARALDAAARRRRSTCPRQLRRGRVPLRVERGRDGDREAGRGHPRLRRRRDQARTADEGRMTMAAAPFPRCDETAAWAALQRTFPGRRQAFDVRTAMDAQRVAAFSLQAPHVFADLSKNLVDAATHDLLLQLARDCGWKRSATPCSGRAHQRTETARSCTGCCASRRARVDAGRGQGAGRGARHAGPMLAFAEQVRSDAAITDVVNIGIGGSDLGPQMASSRWTPSSRVASASTSSPTSTATSWRPCCAT